MAERAETIFEEATGMPLLPADMANERILDLDREVRNLRRRNADLETGLKMATALCRLKQSGFCYRDCRAMPFCENCGTLNLLSGGELPEFAREALDA